MEGAVVAATTNMVALIGVIAVAIVLLRGTGRDIVIGLAGGALFVSLAGLIEFTAGHERGLAFLIMAVTACMIWIAAWLLTPALRRWWQARQDAAERAEPRAARADAIQGWNQFGQSISMEGIEDEDDDIDWVAVGAGSAGNADDDGLREPLRAGHGTGSGADSTGTLRGAAGTGESGRPDRSKPGAGTDGSSGSAGADSAGNGVVWRPAVAAADRGGRRRGRRLMVAVPESTSADGAGAGGGVAAGAVGDAAAA